MRFSVLIPTKNRQERLKECLQSAAQTAHNLTEIEFLFYVDEDDNQTNEDELIKQFPSVQMKFFRKPPTEIQGKRYNFLLSQSSGHLLMYAADDIIFESQYWDKRVYNRFMHCQDRILLVYPKTKNYKCRLAAHGFVSRRSTEVLGRIFTNYFRAVHDDTWITDVYKTLNRAFCMDEITIRHKHPSFDKTVYDDVYRINKINAKIDSMIFEQHKKEIQRDITALQRAINTFHQGYQK